MKISDGIEILKAEYLLGRTPKGRPLSEYAKDSVSAVLQDTENYESDLTQCTGCGFVGSILLTSSGCPNCGVEDLTLNIEQNKGAL